MFEHAYSIRNTAVALIATSLLAACATQDSRVNDDLDPLTGVTVVYSDTPVVLYRDNPSYAAYSRNFVHLGPIEINKSGSYKYYLWLGIWSTLQGSEVAQQSDGFASVVLVVDGEPLLLDLAGWTPAAIGTSTPVYPKPYATSLDAYYRVTADQIRLIAQARELQLRTTGTYPLEFQMWDEQKAAKRDLIKFVRSVNNY